MGHIHNIPPKVLLSWPVPNYVNPSTQGNAAIIVATILPVISLIFVAIRTYTRLFIKRWFGSDDVLIILALVPSPQP